MTAPLVPGGLPDHNVRTGRNCCRAAGPARSTRAVKRARSARAVQWGKGGRGRQVLRGPSHRARAGGPGTSGESGKIGEAVPSNVRRGRSNGAHPARVAEWVTSGKSGKIRGPARSSNVRRGRSNGAHPARVAEWVTSGKGDQMGREPPGPDTLGEGGRPARSSRAVKLGKSGRGQHVLGARPAACSSRAVWRDALGGMFCEGGRHRHVRKGRSNWAMAGGPGMFGEGSLIGRRPTGPARSAPAV